VLQREGTFEVEEVEGEGAPASAVSTAHQDDVPAAKETDGERSTRIQRAAAAEIEKAMARRKKKKKKK
jgi:hypothetical protein